jgi:hypothetical protein
MDQVINHVVKLQMKHLVDLNLIVNGIHLRVNVVINKYLIAFCIIYFIHNIY